jgi:hypothetical protein
MTGKNIPTGPVRGLFRDLAQFLKYFCIFITFFLDSACKMLSIGANLRGSLTVKSPSILSFMEIGSEEMFLSSKEAFLLKQ